MNLQTEIPRPSALPTTTLVSLPARLHPAKMPRNGIKMKSCCHRISTVAVLRYHVCFGAAMQTIDMTMCIRPLFFFKQQGCNQGRLLLPNTIIFYSHLTTHHRAAQLVQLPHDKLPCSPSCKHLSPLKVSASPCQQHLMAVLPEGLQLTPASPAPPHKLCSEVALSRDKQRTLLWRVDTAACLRQVGSKKVQQSYLVASCRCCES